MKGLFNKTIFTFILSACLMINIHADNLNALESRTIEVKLDDLVGPIYDYDVEWDDMNFIYIETEDYVFNEETNEYDRVLVGNWSSETNSIEIQNNGSDIFVALSYHSSIDSVEGIFDFSSFTLNQGENKKAILNLSGNLSSEFVEYTKVGNILMEVE